MTARRLALARRLGYARFNFLPAYFVPWTPAQLEGLSAAFAGLALLGEIDLQRATVNLFGAHRADRLFGGLLVFHLHETETARLPGGAVGDDRGGDHRAELGKQFLQVA